MTTGVFGMTFINRPTLPENSWHRHPNVLGREFYLNPVEHWLLIKLYAHATGVHSPSLDQIHAAARAEGQEGMPGVAAIRKAHATLQDKGFVQTRKFHYEGVNYRVRSVTLVPGRFDNDLTLMTDEELARTSQHYNAQAPRADIVAQAKRRGARRKTATKKDGGKVVSMDGWRAATGRGERQVS